MREGGGRGGKEVVKVEKEEGMVVLGGEGVEVEDEEEKKKRRKVK